LYFAMAADATLLNLEVRAMKRLRFALLVVVLVSVVSCGGARLGEPISVPRDKTVSFAGGDLKIRSCNYLREYLAPTDEHPHGSEEWYNYLEVTVNGQDRRIERPLDENPIVVDGYEITILEMEPEREVGCIVAVERID
jgi:hypothetical protein